MGKATNYRRKQDWTSKDWVS